MTGPRKFAFSSAMDFASSILLIEGSIKSRHWRCSTKGDVKNWRKVRRVVFHSKNEGPFARSTSPGGSAAPPHYAGEFAAKPSYFGIEVRAGLARLARSTAARAMLNRR